MKVPKRANWPALKRPSRVPKLGAVGEAVGSRSSAARGSASTRLQDLAGSIDARLVAVSLVLIGCVIFGGTASQQSFATTVCLAGALALLASELWSDARVGAPFRGGAVLLAAAAVLGMIQLLPLPPWLWQSLPGRALVTETLVAVGLPTETFRPLTLDPLATAASILYVVPALAMFVAVSRLRQPGREALLMLLIGLALVSVLYGFVRAAGIALPWDTPGSERFLRGFFANQNHQADLLLIALASCTGLISQRDAGRPMRRVLLGLAGAVSAAAVIGTMSRAGIGLLVAVVPACIGLLWSQRVIRGQRALAIGAGLALSAIAVWSAAPNFLPRLLRRIQTQGIDDDRFQIWQEVFVVAQTYFPAGSGLGTFDRVYMISERLDYLSPVFVNQAHNEYLQVLVEAGLGGTILLAAAVAWYLVRSYRAWCTSDALAKSASIAAGVYVLHSLGDYPLRTLAHASIAGLMMALLSGARRDPAEANGAGPHPEP